MAERIHCHASCVIPLVYKCSQCGKQSTSTIPISVDHSDSVTLFGGSRESQIRAAELEAKHKLDMTVTEVYADGPLQCNKSIVGQCASCGHQELWQTSGKSYTAQTILGTILGLLLIVACIVVPIVIKMPLLIPVLLIVIWFTLLSSNSLLNKLTSKKKAAKEKAIQNLPNECKPVFALSCKEMLQNIK